MYHGTDRKIVERGKKMTKIFHVGQIKDVLSQLDPIQAIEKGFVAYSNGDVVVPPVGELSFNDPPGEVHIKYGYIIDDAYYVIKIASGFYENPTVGLPPNNGLMLVFTQKTGELESVLLDEGYLTDVRTAAAGAVVARYLAPHNVRGIGVLGTGVQGKIQLEYLKQVVDCRDVVVWGRTREHLDAYKQEMGTHGYRICTTMDANKVAQSLNLIVTATPAKSPLLTADQIQRGTHITAVGSDTPEKNELDPEILKRADIVVADSISQCLERGEIHHALNTDLIQEEDLVELGNIIANKDLRRISDDQITVADLTGVAVQDIQIATAVYEVLTT